MKAVHLQNKHTHLKSPSKSPLRAVRGQAPSTPAPEASEDAEFVGIRDAAAPGLFDEGQKLFVFKLNNSKHAFIDGQKSAKTYVIVACD